ncbi:non-ribosomal peptide synthetase, partial [Aquimarina sp. 2304DJ70-9]|uniref:non-ribosomal peptide synthetase n=1 Tax=Aquimarina penaris TaxID=3231044 RepID=UPI0034624FC1
LACIGNQSYQYEALIDELKIERDTSRNPLFDVLFSYQNFIEKGLDIPGLKLSEYPNDSRMSKFDMSLTATGNNNQFSFSIAYSLDLFTEQTIERFVGYYKSIVAAVTENIDIKLSDINILSAEEQNQLVDEFNDTYSPYPREDSIVSVFETHVNNTPDQTALIYGDTKLTYAELNQRSNTVAHYLLDKGVQKGDVVGVMLNRSIEMIVGIIAVLKTGGIYLPLDGTQPKQRVLHSLKDSKAVMLLTDQGRKEQYQELITTIDIDTGMIDKMPSHNTTTSIDSTDAAYIIYTSGSTGRPKGVAVGHQSVINLVCFQRETYTLKDDDRILQLSEIVFDASVEQLWTALLSGVSLVLIDKETMLSSKNFNDYIRKHEVTCLLATPTFLENIEIEFHEKLRNIVVGGEVCNAHIANKLYKNYNLFNAYGPTEATVISTVHAVKEQPDSDTKIPIGKPIHNTQAYILGSNKELLPIGVIGELYVGGESLAHGYLHNDKLTQERFVDNPYRANGRMYKTGDLARWLPDGNIEFLGRIDEQIKIRGFRIELGEIESELRNFEALEEAILVVKEKEGDRYLVCYYTALEEISTSDLKSYLSDKLPEYMIPNHYVHLTSIPFNSSGKVDKKNLPEPEVKIEHDYVRPSNKIECLIAKIWAEVLALDEKFISVDKSFFELGGHSLKAIALVNKIAKEFELEITLREIFDNPKINSLSDYIITVKQIEIEIEKKDNIIELTI